MAVTDLAQLSWMESQVRPEVAVEKLNVDGPTTEPVTMLMLAHQLHEEHVAEGRARAEALVADARRTASAMQDDALEAARRQRDALIEQAHRSAAEITADARADLARLQDSRDIVERELGTLRDSVSQATRELERLQGRLAEARAAIRAQAQSLLDCAED